MNRETSQLPRRSPAGWVRGFLERHRKKLLVAKYTVIFALGVFLAWTVWGRGHSATSENGIQAADSSGGEAQGPTMWTCSMHPQIRSSSPGDCPICGMDLIPVAKTAAGMRTLTISPDAKALMNIEVTPVERRYVTHEIPMVGKVDYDETKLGYITAWVPGRLDRLYVDYTGVDVKQGDHMVYIYSEQLYAAQQELIESLKSARARGKDAGFFNTGGVDLLESSREKLRLLGLTLEQIAEIEKLE
ncbi:efflux RND transporter periplasmic adaptor subunit, partial [Symmachiella dynata]|uniref:efflux RND transporter periplasmic adaptor subunit n=1 Tax=Symmachiella dynata TaxID=2527995 RepID=UPI0030EE7799